MENFLCQLIGKSEAYAKTKILERGYGVCIRPISKPKTKGDCCLVVKAALSGEREITLYVSEFKTNL